MNLSFSLRTLPAYKSVPMDSLRTMTPTSAASAQSTASCATPLRLPAKNVPNKCPSSLFSSMPTPRACRTVLTATLRTWSPILVTHATCTALSAKKDLLRAKSANLQEPTSPSCLSQILLVSRSALMGFSKTQLTTHATLVLNTARCAMGVLSLVRNAQQLGSSKPSTSSKTFLA